MLIAGAMTVWFEWRVVVLRNTKIQMAAILAAGILLGFLAALGGLSAFARAGADPLPPGAKAGRPAGRQNLLAMAGSKLRATLKGKQKGDKPNILFIMGDDIGWMQ